MVTGEVDDLLDVAVVLYTSLSLVRPSRTAATVAEEEEGEEAASSRLCSSASTSASLVRLLDGRLTDLWWKAIVLWSYWKF